MEEMKSMDRKLEKSNGINNSDVDTRWLKVSRK